MNVGYDPTRQPQGIAPPVNLPQNYGMADKQAEIRASGQIASASARLAPTLMKLGVDLRLKDEERFGYTKELQARSKADYAAFQSTASRESAELVSDLSKINDKDMMNEVVDLRFNALRDRVTGANGEIPLIRDKREQDKYLHYMDTVLRPHWETSVYTRSATVDAENTKAKSDAVMIDAVDNFDINGIETAAQIKLDAGLSTPEQFNLEVKQNTQKAEKTDIARITTAVASGNRFSYLSALGMTEQEAENKGLTTPDLAKQFADKMVKRLNSGLYKYTSSDDINRAVADVYAGVEAVKIKSDTSVRQAENIVNKNNKKAVYGTIDGVASIDNINALTPDLLYTTITNVNPEMPSDEAAKIVNNFVTSGSKEITESNWGTYNQLLYKTYQYKPDTDPDGKKAANLYTEIMRKMPQQQAFDLITRLNKRSQGKSLGKLGSDGEAIFTKIINDKFKAANNWDGIRNIKEITVGTNKKKINQAEAMFREQFFTYVEQNGLNQVEAREYLESMPLFNHLDQIDNLSKYENLLRVMNEPLSSDLPSFIINEGDVPELTPEEKAIASKHPITF